jgi:dTDP-4-dehydrorhamnose 3,5-epimerase
MRTTIGDIPGLYLIDSEPRSDERGSFGRWYCADELSAVMPDAAIAQINHSVTREQGTIRGMHFQHAPHAEKKIIRCLAGKVFDVAVDLRRHSPTFLQWRGFTLEAGDNRALLIPEGCAHGFQALTNDVQLLYLHTAPYTPSAEGAVRFDDPRVGIVWPLPPHNISVRDLQHPLLKSDFSGIVI